MPKEEISVFRKILHEALINKLIKLYKKDRWKYTFIKNAKSKFNYPVQYHQLSEFEKGKPRNENIINIMILEILTMEKDFTLKVLSVKEINIK